MAEMHLTFELLRARERGLVGRREVAELALGHLLGLCDTCADEYREALEREETAADTSDAAGEDAADYPPAAYEGLVDRVLGRLDGFEAVARDRAGEARARADELLELPVEEALERIGGGRIGDDGDDAADPDSLAKLSEKLLDTSTAAVPARPRHSFDAARLAEAVAWKGAAAEDPGEDRWHELLVRAIARQANAVRVLGDLRAAERLFSEARAHLRGHRVTDLETYAEIDSLEGSLYAQRGRLGRAMHLLERAITFYALREDRLNLARSLATQSSVLERAGEIHAALASAEAARSLVPPGLDDDLLLLVSYNKSLGLLELGLGDLAENALDSARALAGPDTDPRMLLHLFWLGARIDLGRGRRERARRGLLDARDRFRARGDRPSAAQATLDLAALELREGRSVRVRERVEEAAELLAGRELDDRASRALERLGEAALQGAVTSDLLDAAARALKILFP